MVDVGVVLAGGGSQRMGVDKADLDLAGSTFLDRAVALLETRFGEILVAGGTRAAGTATLVADTQPDSGPLGGIAAALAHSGRDIFVMPVDVPTLSADAVDRLREPSLLAGQVRVARVDGRVHPLIGAYPHDLLGLIEQRLASDDRSVVGLLRSIPVLSLVDIDDGSVIEVNTPQDLELLSADG